MKTHTKSRPEQRNSRSTHKKRYAKQTAHVEARRDGTPLIFGWGTHLSRSEKIRIRRRAVWSLAVLFFIAIITIVVGFWVNFNIISPSLPITSVNGQNIPQADYHKLVVLRAQLELNKLQGPNGLNVEKDNLNKQISEQQKIVDDKKAEIEELNKQAEGLSEEERKDLETKAQELLAVQNEAQAKIDALQPQWTELTQTRIPLQETFYTQSQLANTTVQWLQEDIILQNWLNDHPDLKDRIIPGEAQINEAMNAFKNDLPHSGKSVDQAYNDILNENRVSDADMRTMMALKLRRDNMQEYQASLITSPTRQVQARLITLATEDEAKDILQQLQNGGDFAALAKEKSLNSTTKENGGDLGWLAPGQYLLDYNGNLYAYIEKWISDPARTINELSPVIQENGSYHVLQITGIEPTREVESEKLQKLKDNAFNYWRLLERANPDLKITDPDARMQFDPINMPQNIPFSPQSTPAPTSTVLPTDNNGIPTELEEAMG